jgi:hypothetical protein
MQYRSESITAVVADGGGAKKADRSGPGAKADMPELSIALDRFWWPLFFGRELTRHHTQTMRHISKVPTQRLACVYLNSLTRSFCTAAACAFELGVALARGAGSKPAAEVSGAGANHRSGGGRYGGA